MGWLGLSWAVRGQSGGTWLSQTLRWAKCSSHGLVSPPGISASLSMAAQDFKREEASVPRNAWAWKSQGSLPHILLVKALTSPRSRWEGRNCVGLSLRISNQTLLNDGEA